MQNIRYNKNSYYDMPFIQLKFQQVFYFLRVLGTITNTWPPNSDIGKNELLLRNFYCCISTFIFITVWISMLMYAYKTRNDDVGELMNHLSHMITLIEAILNSIMCTIKRKQLQVMISSNMFFCYTTIIFNNYIFTMISFLH